MNDVFISTVGGLLAFWFWGTSDWLVSKSSKRHNVYEVNLANRVASIILVPILLALNYQAISGLEHILPFIAVGVIFVAANLCMVKALKDGSVGVIVPIISINPLFTLILALIFGGSLLSQEQIIVILIILSGIVLMTYQKNTHKIPLKVLHKDTIYALVAALLWGIAFYILNQSVTGVPWEVVYSMVGITTIVASLALFYIRYQKASLERMRRIKSNTTGMLAGLLLSLGSIAFFYSAEQVGNVLILIVISACAPLAASLLSALYDHEKLGLMKRIGAVMAVGGIVLLNII